MARIILQISLFISLAVVGSARAGDIEFIENLGQWEEQVRYKVEMNMGALFLEPSGFTYHLRDLDVYRNAHSNHTPLPEYVRGHAFKATFVGANPEPVTQGEGRSLHYRNYFLGDDPQKWKGHVHSFDQVIYNELYNGVDLKVYQHSGNLKYDLILAPFSNPAQIQLEYEGLDDLKLQMDGDLLMRTSLMDIVETRPVAFQMVNGKRSEVRCRFVLRGNRVSFEFPDGYDNAKELIIDPELIFSTYSGSTGDNFGSTATYDNSGHLYGGGTAFGAGYPTTMGAYQQQTSQNIGGTADIGLSKFAPDGSSLVFSTYIGGTANETVHSIVVNQNNELCLLGTSISGDYPTTPNAFQTVNNGGTTVTWTVGYGMGYAGGCDMVLSKFSPDGSSLMGSTFVGGSGNDGLNVGSLVDFNYGDPFRGEVNTDAAGNIYVASCTESANFPVTAGAAQTTIGGGRDGVVFKMNPNLTNIQWATFVGGNLNDNAYAVQLSDAGEIAIAGGTLSTNFPATAGAYATTNHGQVDGWVMKLAPNGSAIQAATYVGSNKYDQVYFVQFDPNDDIYVLGQTDGTIPVTPSTVYNNPNSGQFIQKFSNDLSTLLLSTTVGRGSGEVDISPTAFLVSNCGQIYLSGWGGSTNNANGNTTASTTNGLPVTSDAFQPNTDGHDFYLMVLAEDASDLTYATYFGGSVSHEHVDGGTSRFDKNGVVYQAVCAGCGSHDDFPSTPGAWSPTNPSPNCNLGVFKFDLNQVISVPDFEVLLDDCSFPIQVEFTNNSSGANSFIWIYGDGDVATVEEESHFYSDPGDYEVMLIALDSMDCLSPDTGIVSFSIPEPPIMFSSGSDTICSLDTVPLLVEGVGIISYEWSPAEWLDDPHSTTPNAIPLETTTYTIIGTDSIGCSITQEVIVYVSEPPYSEAGENTYLQPGVSGELYANVNLGSTVEWSPPEGLSCTDCLNPIADPQETTTYYLLVTDELGCTNIDSVIVYSYPTIYVPNAFTPGGNDRNPVFYVYGTGIADFTLTIFNRWGQMIYQSNDMAEGWDGTMNGHDVQTGVYIWTLQYSTDVEPLTFHSEIGHVTLLRNVY